MAGFSKQILLLVLIFSSFSVVAQTGPGGVGNSSGTPGQPQNVVWLRAGIGVNSSGGLVNSWADQSGNANNASGVGTTRPTINASDANFNGLASLSFPNTASTNYNLTVQDADNLDGTTGLTAFYIFRPTNATGTLGILSKRVDNGSNQSYVFYQSGGSGMTSRIGTNNVTAGTIANNQVFISSTVFDGTLAAASRVAPFLNGTAQPLGTGPATITNTASDLFIGAFDVSSGETRSFEGTLAEIVIYNQALNPAQRQIVENYLSAKYASTLTAGDIYAGDTPGNGNYDFEVIGIGRSGGQSHTTSNSAGFLMSIYDGTFDVDGEFVMAGHNGVANGVSVANLGTGVQQRWARAWYIDKTTAGSVNAELSFDFSEGVGGQFPSNKNNYVLLRLTAGNYEIVPIANGSKIVVGDKITFQVPNADLVDGVYTLGTIDATNSPLLGVANRTWYSYQTGTWTTPTVWTLDGGVVPLYVNPLSEIPSAIDSVVITSGRTVTLNTNNISLLGITVRGTLDLSGSSGNSFTRIAGDGRIRMSGNGGIDNFPSGDASSFADPTLGGTLELNGAGITLSTNREFNNLVINMNSSGTVISHESNWTLNGNMVINTGQWRFGNASATTARSLTVAGTLTIESAGQIRTGAGNARHQLNLYGDLYNNGGDIQFTNRVAANYTAEATDGIVDVNLLSAIQNQTLNFSGPSRFYRIEIDKGVDQTYIATLSGDPGMFSLFGYANENHGSVNQLNDNNNALGLVRGTVEIGQNIAIAQLTNGANYNISEGAAIWINGGSVAKTSGTALVPYGLIRLTSGTLNLPINSGITTRDNGTIQVEGGTLTANQIRTSVLGVGNVGGYIQSGGSVTVNGGAAGGTNLDYYVFSLTYPGNVFNMSGGTLTVKGTRSGTSGTRGAIFINSDPANVSVTGGNIIAEISNANPYRITTKAALWNLTTVNTFNTTLIDVDLEGGESGDDGTAGEVSLGAQPLVVLGGLTIGNYTNFDHNGNNVSIQGNFTIQTNGDYVFNNGKQNTTTINGTDNSLLAFYNRYSLGAGDEQRFWNFVIDKPADKVVTLESGKTDRTGNNNNLLRTDGTYFKLLGGTLDQGTHSLRMYCDSIVVYGTLGLYNIAAPTPDSNPNSNNDLIKLRDDNLATKLVTSSNAKIGNLRLNSGAEVIDLVSNLYIGRIDYRFGRINLGSYNLKLDVLANNLGAEADSLGLSSGVFSVEDMFITNGNASDGGLSLYVPAGTVSNTNFTFPVGVGIADDNANNPNGAKFTPAVIRINNGVDDGYITVNPVSGILQTTNLAGGPDILNHYWRVRHEGFSTLPNVSRMYFFYVAADVGGTETNYVSGKVLDVNPFTRSHENNVNDVDETLKRIRFNSGFTLEQANYTAGGTARFTGAPTVYYTRRLADGYNTDWRDGTIWTLGLNGAFGKHDSRQAAAGNYPKAGDIAVVGWVPFGDTGFPGNQGYPHGVAIQRTETFAELRFEQMKDVSNNPTARVYYRNFQFRPTVVINNNGGANVGQIASGAVISGEGAFWVRSTGGNLSDPDFSINDLGQFSAQDSSYLIYESTLANATYTNLPATTPNLMMVTDGWGAQDKSSTITKDVVVNGNLELLGDINLVLNTGATGDITVNKNLVFFRSNVNGNDSGGGGELRFGNTGTERTVNVLGNISLGNGYAAIIRVQTPGTTPLTHHLNLYGNFTQNTTAGNGFKGGTNAANDRIHMSFLGSTSTQVNYTAGDIPQFYSLTVNKGNSQATSVTFNSAFTVNAPTNTATKPLKLQSGLAILNNGATNINLTTGGGDFSIPAAAGLQVNLGQVNVSGANTGILLDGLLRVNGGTVNLDGGAGINNYIEYSASGNATLEVIAGTLTVGSQIRRNLTSTAGVLRYSQSGGTVVIGKNAAPSTSRGVFEVINTGSQFNLTGGTFTLVRGVNSPTVPSLLLEPATSNVAGSTITIGNANTPSGLEAQNIGIKSAIAVNNLITSNSSGNNPIVKLYSLPLTVNGTLTIGTGTSFDARGFALNLAGNFVADGTYIPSNNTTFFTANGATSISGSSPSLAFYKMTKNGTGTLSLSRAITVNDELWLATGTLSDGGNSIFTKATVTVDATHTSSGGSGLVFNGSSTQQLRRSASGTGILGIVTIDNANSVLIPDGNGYNFLINGGLRLSSGVFDIQGSLLEIGVNAPITAVNPFGAFNMIQTNSSFTDNGVQKNFNAGVTTDFIFPVGQGKYTPVEWDFSSPGYTTGGSAGTITVRPANERHPSVVEDVEVTPPQITDIDNVLQYHWIVSATGFATTFRADAIMGYNQGDVQVTAPYTEADYIAARILTFNNPNADINKFPVTDVDEAANTIIFRFSGVNYLGIDGEYFAGVDPAIPDRLPVYTTVMSGAVDAAIYDVPVPGGGAPTGAIIQVSTGHTVDVDIDGLSLYATRIATGGEMVIDGTIGHRLGTVTGTGVLRLNSNTNSVVLPAGFYNQFFSCSGGGLAFGGTGNYDILGGITSLRSLTLDGSGQRILANNDLTVCEDFTVNGASFTNPNNRTIVVNDELIILSGSFTAGNGLMTIRGNTSVSGGVIDCGNAGTKTFDNDVFINGGSFTSGAGIIRYRGDLIYSSGSFSGGTGTNWSYFDGGNLQTISGNFTGANSIYRIRIDNSAGVDINSNIEVQRTLLLLNGLVNTGANTVALELNGFVSPASGSANSFVNGRFSKVMNSGQTFTFPIGRSNRWRYMTIQSPSSGPRTWTAEYIGVAATTEPGVTNFTPTNSIIKTIARGEYWRVSDGSATPSGVTARIGLSWGIESDVSSSSVEREDLQVMAWNTSTSTWDNFGGTTFSAGHTQSRGDFRSSSAISFSTRIVTLGSSDFLNPLPITLVSFTGEAKTGYNELHWITESELNNEYYVLERSTDNAETFEEIARLDGKGTTNQQSSYTALDNHPVNGKNYYRLKQVDFNGDYSYADNIVVLYSEVSGYPYLDFKIYPNPTDYSNINLKVFTNNPAVEGGIIVYDIYGKKVFEGTSTLFEDLSLNLPTALAQGIYLVEINQGKLKRTQRLIIN